MVISEISNTEGSFTLKMQRDDNAVVYDDKYQPIWSTSIT